MCLCDSSSKVYVFQHWQSTMTKVLWSVVFLTLPADVIHFCWGQGNLTLAFGIFLTLIVCLLQWGPIRSAHPFSCLTNWFIDVAIWKPVLWNVNKMTSWYSSMPDTYKRVQYFADQCFVISIWFINHFLQNDHSKPSEGDEMCAGLSYCLQVKTSTHLYVWCSTNRRNFKCFHLIHT